MAHFGGQRPENYNLNRIVIDDMTIRLSDSSQKAKLSDLTDAKVTKNSSCVNARDIPPAAYQVLHLLFYPQGGTPSLARVPPF